MSIPMDEEDARYVALAKHALVATAGVRFDQRLRHMLDLAGAEDGEYLRDGLTFYVDGLDISTSWNDTEPGAGSHLYLQADVFIFANKGEDGDDERRITLNEIVARPDEFQDFSEALGL